MPHLKNANLGKQFLEVFLGADPRGNCIAEEDEVLHNTSWVDSDHLANSTEG